MKEKILIVGAGNMGGAIALGISEKKLISKNNITLLDTSSKKLNKYKKLGFKTIKSILEVNKKEILTIILAVKPNNINDFLIEAKPHLHESSLIISIAAGVQIKTLQSLLNKKYQVARVMPNTPCQIGEGISAISYNSKVTTKNKKLVQALFNAIGKVVVVKENSLDAVTALSGSGPAYFCYFIESMIEAGIRNGLNKDISEKLALSTALGTYKLINTVKTPIKKLRASVTSPNGTTQAAISYFRSKSLDNIIVEGITKAKKRSIELGKSK